MSGDSALADILHAWPPRVLLVFLAVVGAMIGLHALTLRLTRAPHIVEFPLQPGERQLWIGTPLQGFRFGRQDALMSCFGVVFIVFMLIPSTLILEMPGRSRGVIAIAALIIGPVLLAAYFLAVGRLIEEIRARRLTTYAITNQRVIVSIGKTTRTRPIEYANKAGLVENRDGSGTIILDAPKILLAPRSVTSPGELREAEMSIASFMQPYHRFENIPDAARVYAILKQAVAVAR